MDSARTIRTVTLCAGFDHRVSVDTLQPGGVSRVLTWAADASGKGVNVARVARHLGASTVAYSLVGREEEAAFQGSLASDGVDYVTVPVPQPTRNNLTLTIRDLDTTAAHAAGPRFSGVPNDAIEALFARLLADTRVGDIVTFNGSLPGGADTSLWAKLARRVTALGALVFADVQGAALKEMVATGLVHATKPNEEELSSLDDAPCELSLRERATYAVIQQREKGVAEPMVTLGADGVVHLAEGRPVRSWCPVRRAQVVVGAGDAFVAGFCSGLIDDSWGYPPVHVALAAAAAHVTGAVGSEFASVTRAGLGRVMCEPV